jgi:probable F420-dependent oxidoreductase
VQSRSYHLADGSLPARRIASVEFGLTFIATDRSIDPAELGRAAEARGFDSLWIPEHTHIPTSRRSPFASGELPPEYLRTLDPFVALSMVAAVTTQLKLATGICLINEHEPIALAKQVASLDHLSNGRFLFGIGAGWNAEEMENHGVNPKLRWRVMRERVLAMKQIWTSDVAEFHGEHVNFEPLWSWPKPVQKPHPPVILGGNLGFARRALLEYCDEWLPRLARDPRPIDVRLAEVNRLAAEQGRAPIPATLFDAPQDPAVVEDLASAGIKSCLFRLPSSGRDEVLATLDRLTELKRICG